ncbi:MAG TPA: phage holin family protein [Actinomycetota bacterium]|nr:phage holin family protein [Actinomycetota bacterium]
MRLPRFVSHAEAAAEEVQTSLSGLATDVVRLVHLEIELAKQEAIGLAKRNGVAIGMMAAGGFCALLFFILGQVWLIVALGHPSLVAGIVTIFWLLAGTILVLVGKSRLDIKAPRRTLQSLKDDLEWAKDQIKPSPR